MQAYVSEFVVRFDMAADYPDFASLHPGYNNKNILRAFRVIRG